ncbi:reverse transcriptase domain-containing protein [Rickettsia endosymbiont of Orchestes rusci]|uniref:reverse transcriptase domain-containing protein n=1 Tax=Rickettsia endosymbiont of Orchestes rusci TaxID=3066250 RepID=UPI00313C5EEC
MLYADDIVVHCASQKQANYILDKISKRLKEFKLELNAEKTKIDVAIVFRTVSMRQY